VAEKAKKKVEGEAAVLESIARMPEPFRAMGERLHALILRANPSLVPRTWYGMPGYAMSKSSPILCFFRADDYMTFGLTEKANLAREEGAQHQLLASAWFLAGLDDATEAELSDIIRKATS
jgi:hypothetical protein